MAETTIPPALKRLAYVLGTPLLIVVGGFLVIGAGIATIVFRLAPRAVRYVITGEKIEPGDWMARVADPIERALERVRP